MEGSVREFLLLQGLSPLKSLVVKERFDNWMRNGNGLPTPIKKGVAPMGNVYLFSELEERWLAYKKCLASMGRKL